MDRSFPPTLQTSVEQYNSTQHNYVTSDINKLPSTLSLDHYNHPPPTYIDLTREDVVEPPSVEIVNPHPQTLCIIDVVNNINTMSGKALYYGEVPGPSYEDRINWFNHPLSHENQHQIRIFPVRDEPNELFIYRLLKDYDDMVMGIERVVVGRCLPAPYRKDVGKKNKYVYLYG